MAFDIVIGGDAQPSTFDIVIGDTGSPPPTLVAGTTLAALQAGSSSFKWVIAIEGYKYVLTDATPQQAIDAWSPVVDEHHYELALGGLFVIMDNDQKLTPNVPFGEGGRCSFQVVKSESTDRFGVDTHKRSGGAETSLAETIDRTDTTIEVDSTSTFDASGDIHIGTECIGYTGKTSIAFTTCTRGKYVPFVNGNSGVGYSQHHRVGQNELEVKFNPTVSAEPRTWIGRWVGVYLHKYDAALGALNSMSDALCVYAGKIVAISDDGSTGATTVELKHVLDVVGDSTIAGRDQWSARVRNTIHLEEGLSFGFIDYVGAAGSMVSRTANPLTIKAAGTASGNNEVDAGFYTAEELFAKLNLWLRSERLASRLWGSYSFGFFEPEGGYRSVFIHWINPASTSDTVDFRFSAPNQVFQRLGWNSQGGDSTAGLHNNFVASPPGTWVGSTYNSYVADNPYLKVVVNDYGSWSVQVDQADGTFFDQYSSLPSSCKPATSDGAQWGVFLVDSTMLAFGIYAGSTLERLKLLPEQFGYQGAFTQVGQALQAFSKSGQPDYTTIKQVAVLELPLHVALAGFFLSTGTSGYNDASNDFLGHGLGLGIPRGICGDAFLDSLAALPSSDKPIVVIMDKTIRFTDVFSGDLQLRRAYLRWKSGGLEFTQWRTPVAGNAVGFLEEANKAAPAGTVDHHRCVTKENGHWARPIVKIRFNRSVNSAEDNEGYRDSITVVDKTALDDMGGEGPTLTINARNTFGEFGQTGSPIHSLATGFLATMPFFSRPARETSRSIDIRYFEGYAVGDVFGWTDEYARDPDTGQRAVQTRYAIITRHGYTLGGDRAGSSTPDDMGGYVELYMFDVNRVAYYAPSAQIDDTATGGGYNAGAITVYAHKYSESYEAVDASRFTAGMKIRIVEIDPADPAAPASWDRTILTVVGNVITPTVALSSPAWDAAKKYRITFDDYADATAAQQLGYSFQADDADGMIVNARVPYQYSAGGADAAYTAWSGSDPVELPPNSTYVEGAPRDVGHDVALVRLLNNLMSYKTAVSSPQLFSAVAAADPGAPTSWALVHATPIHLGDDVLLNDVWRRVAVAPHFRSGDGSVSRCRITLARNPPHAVGFATSGMGDVDRGSFYSEVTFTTSSTTWSTPAADNLVANMKGSDGTAWLLVELDGACETYGLALVQEGPLLY